MHSRNPRTLLILAAAQITDTGLQWIEVMPTADKARNGPWYFTITEPDLEIFAQSIRDSPGQIPIDYDHDGADGGSTRAAGWFTGEAEVVAAGGVNRAGVEQTSASLWAEVKWTPQARQEIQDGVFKRISPEWTQAEKDTKTGLLTKAKDIVAATLTNRPFFRDLTPVTAADVVWDDSMGYSRRMAQISEQLNPGDTWRYCVLDVGDAAALIQENGAEAWVIGFTVNPDGSVELAPASDWQPAEQQWVAAATEARQTINAGAAGSTTKEHEMPAELKAVAVALGLAEDADEDAVTAAVTALKDKTPADGTLVVAADELTELKAQAALGVQASKELAETRVENLITAAVAAGKILPVVADEFKAMAAENYDGTKAIIDKMPGRTLRPIGSGAPGPDEPDSEEVTKASEQYASTEADTVDLDSVRVDLRAREILTERGKTFDDASQAEYLSAARAATDELAVR